MKRYRGWFSRRQVKGSFNFAIKSWIGCGCKNSKVHGIIFKKKKMWVGSSEGRSRDSL